MFQKEVQAFDKSASISSIDFSGEGMPSLLKLGFNIIINKPFSYFTTKGSNPKNRACLMAFARALILAVTPVRLWLTILPFDSEIFSEFQYPCSL